MYRVVLKSHINIQSGKYTHCMKLFGATAAAVVQTSYKAYNIYGKPNIIRHR